MQSSKFWLLTNEGYLLRACLQNALLGLRKDACIDEGGFCLRFFNYSIGLERLLKVILILDHYHQSKGQFPSNATLKSFGHDLVKLHATCLGLLSTYGVTAPPASTPDDIDKALLQFLADFARSNRYYNLDALAGSTASANPLAQIEGILERIYENDVSPLRRVSGKDQTEALIEQVDGHVYAMPIKSLGGSPSSWQERTMQQNRIILSLPELWWRLIKLLLPFREFLIEVIPAIHKRAQERGAAWDVPHMDEFLYFISENRSVNEESEDEEEEVN